MIVADLDSYAIQSQYDLIIISFFYVHSHVAPSIINALIKEGILLYENHMLSASSAEDEASKHRFHLKPGELKQLFRGLKIIHYEECQVERHIGRPSYIARLVAQK